MIDTEKLRAIPIERVAAALGFEITRGSARCRLPGHDDKNPSFSVRSQTNRFQCFACGRGGDAIELVKIMLGTDFLGACDWLGKQFGPTAASKAGQLRRQFSVPFAPIRTVENEASTDAELEGMIADYEVFDFVLSRSPLAEDGREYLFSRHFSPSTIQKYKVGQIGDSRKLRAELLAEFGSERVVRCGLLTDGHYGPYFPIKSGYLLFPFFDGGRVAYLQGRKLGTATGPRWLCPARIRPPAFNLDVLSASATTILICEGVTDVLSAHELSINSIGLIGANARLDLRVLNRLKGRNVAVLGDADSAGKGFAKRVIDLLAINGITSTAKKLPVGFNDLND